MKKEPNYSSSAQHLPQDSIPNFHVLNRPPLLHNYLITHAIKTSFKTKVKSLPYRQQFRRYKRATGENTSSFPLEC